MPVKACPCITMYACSCFFSLFACGLTFFATPARTAPFCSTATRPCWLSDPSIHGDLKLPLRQPRISGARAPNKKGIKRLPASWVVLSLELADAISPVGTRLTIRFHLVMSRSRFYHVLFLLVSMIWHKGMPCLTTRRS